MLTLKDRVRLALSQDGSIVATREEARTKEGFTTEYLVSIGFTKQDLKKLERGGLALRGYVPSKTGHTVRWILIADRD